SLRPGSLVPEDPGERGSWTAADLEAIGARWTLGQEVDWQRLHRGERRRRGPLPTYPFERRRFWVERGSSHTAPSAGAKTTQGAAAVRTGSSATYRAPRDAIERDLAGVWGELLGVERVGLDDDFFELGGQSILALRLFDELRRKYGVDLPLST